MQSSCRENDIVGIFRLIVYNVSVDCFDMDPHFLSISLCFLKSTQRKIEGENLKAVCAK